ncbi:hypothetical protein UFOVP1290_224 [uncultured Caudovirales phage]|uniref:Lipoprotein n=1 Tax=uncultured Caudovirales phage TaxID=2100421 RepID=A0A6J5RXG5_9CAUD|nr:hypothetical protein UFOVP1290_224 [uncultured Caudovirales phage]
MKKIFAILFAFTLCGCTNESDSRRTLDNSGFTDIKLHGYAWFACDKNDLFHTEFTAKNPNGKVVSGVVCCGILKSCTVRF